MVPSPIVAEPLAPLADGRAFLCGKRGAEPTVTTDHYYTQT
jgi:hypothetical protein